MSDTSEKKWEYRVQAVIGLATYGRGAHDGREAEPELKQLGEDGWELVGFQGKDAYFKRRMAPKDGPQSIFEE